MEILYHQNVVPRILMTITAIALAIGPAIADFNKTHATNPLWPPHARFHVVWQVITNSTLCLMLLFILWTPLVAQYNLQLVLVVMVQGAILAPLYITIASMRIFDGALKDVNGIRPFKFRIAGKTLELDTNVVGFTNLSLVLIIACFNIVSSVPAP
ncbi:MAG: small-conductance mechanosensitive channel [Patiriisocius sp.]|jgi:small-conductance mechanosensitive channel